MTDFAKFGRKHMVFFDPGQTVRYHLEGNGPYNLAKVIRTARTRVLIEDLDDGKKQKWVPNLWLSHPDVRSAHEGGEQ